MQPYVKNLEAILVPDITVDDAFFMALEGVTYVIHTASPLPGQSGDFETNTIQPAIHGTTSILKSALKVPTIKRVVITSSTGAIAGNSETEVYDGELPCPSFPAITTTNITDSTILPRPHGPYANSLVAYGASKVLALHATKDFIAENHPKYSVVNLMPAYVIGRNEMATSPANLTAPSASNGFLLSNILGNNIPFPMMGRTVHIEDVASVHVQALTSEEVAQGGEDFVLTSGNEKGNVWDDSLEIVNRRYPEAVESGLLPMGGHTPTGQCKIDGTKAERVFGFVYKGFEDQVVDLVGQYIELAKKEKA